MWSRTAAARRPPRRRQPILDRRYGILRVFRVPCLIAHYADESVLVLAGGLILQRTDSRDRTFEFGRVLARPAFSRMNRSIVRSAVLSFSSIRFKICLDDIDHRYIRLEFLCCLGRIGSY